MKPFGKTYLEAAKELRKKIRDGDDRNRTLQKHRQQEWHKFLRQKRAQNERLHHLKNVGVQRTVERERELRKRIRRKDCLNRERRREKDFEFESFKEKWRECEVRRRYEKARDEALERKCLRQISRATRKKDARDRERKKALELGFQAFKRNWLKGEVRRKVHQEEEFQRKKQNEKKVSNEIRQRDDRDREARRQKETELQRLKVRFSESKERKKRFDEEELQRKLKKVREFKYEIRRRDRKSRAKMRARDAEVEKNKRKFLAQKAKKFETKMREQAEKVHKERLISRRMRERDAHDRQKKQAREFEIRRFHEESRRRYLEGKEFRERYSSY